MSFVNNIGDRKQTPDVSIPVSETRARTKASVEESALSIDSTKTDEATLSAASGLIAQALGGSDVRSTKVETLRQSIADGTYSVPSIEVASKIMQTMNS